MYTERPEFCTTCHIMRPYYESWKESKHHEVNCLECHYEPNLKAHAIGKIKGLVEVAQYLTHKYSPKPASKVNDTSCLRKGCHVKDDLRDKEVMFEDKIEFNHDIHFGELRAGIKLGCTTCHNQLTSDKHISVDKNVCFCLPSSCCFF